jgi:hypothetical protein
MKKFLLTASAAALVLGVAAPASAQSVLERVLAQTASLNNVTGVFANVADNVGSVSNLTDVARTVEAGDVITLDVSLDDGEGGFTYDYVTATVGEDGTMYYPDGSPVVDDLGTEVRVRLGSQLYQDTDGTFTVDSDAVIAGRADDYNENGYSAVFETIGSTGGSIDGSITNVATRIDQATANVDNQVTAISDVTANFGNMSTTVLGAVNTGEIGLGTNQVVEEALANTSSAIRSTIGQVGTIADSTQVVLNSALNTMAINGSISNTLTGVNGSVAAVSPDQLDIIASVDGAVTLAGLDQLLGTMSTTVLGAVNTGTIVSGVNNQIEGTVAGIVGNSATNMFAEAPAAGN